MFDQTCIYIIIFRHKVIIGEVPECLGNDVFVVADSPDFRHIKKGI